MAKVNINGVWRDEVISAGGDAFLEMLRGVTVQLPTNYSTGQGGENTIWQAGKSGDWVGLTGGIPMTKSIFPLKLTLSKGATVVNVNLPTNYSTGQGGENTIWQTGKSGDWVGLTGGISMTKSIFPLKITFT